MVQLKVQKMFLQQFSGCLLAVEYKLKYEHFRHSRQFRQIFDNPGNFGIFGNIFENSGNVPKLTRIFEVENIFDIFDNSGRSICQNGRDCQKQNVPTVLAMLADMPELPGLSKTDFSDSFSNVG